MIRKILRKLGIYITTLVLVAVYPLAGIAGAQEVTSTPTTDGTTTQTAPDQTATTDTSTATTTAPEPTYTYNPQTGHWDSSEWQYNPITGVYEKPPAPVIITPPVDSSSTQATSDTTASTNASVNNNVNISATSGDATVSSNTAAGNAASGDASSTATIINNVNSTLGLDSNSKVASFTQNVLGDVNGDIILSPLILKAMLEAQAPANLQSTAAVNNNLTANNIVNVGATSGNATVANNTTAGNATSGSATAVANVVNILNSLIATQQSFVGTINIYGNLNGDILIAPDFIPKMLSDSSVSGGSSNAQVSNQDTQTIVNNISAVASSGAASVFGNTSAGNATTGSAQSNVVIFNLSGHQIIAQNSLLVFVNVLGKWVGVIVDAPQGATSALIGNGVVSDTYTPDLTVQSQSKYGITNTIAVDAQSGNATVTNNTNAGNATSGNAKALVNVANITGSQFSLTGWFGILFINVFQNWYGSFGIDTPYGNPPTTTNQPPAQPVEFRPTAVNYSNATLRIIDSRDFTETETNATHNPAPIDIKPVGQQAVLAAAITKASQPDSQDFRLLIIAGSMIVIGFSAIGLKRLLS